VRGPARGRLCARHIGDAGVVRRPRATASASPARHSSSKQKRRVKHGASQIFLFLSFLERIPFSPSVAPRLPIRYIRDRVFLFSAESVCAVCERERVQAAQSADVGQREGVSARGTVSNAGAVRRCAPQLQQASARQASASQMLLMRAAAAVQSAAPTQEEGAAQGCPRNAACTLALTLTVLQWTPAQTRVEQ